VVVGWVERLRKSGKTKGAKLLFYGVFFLFPFRVERGREEILLYGLVCPFPFLKLREGMRRSEG